MHRSAYAASETSAALTDPFGRPLRNLRVSLIDMCNLRCGYCMPEEEYTWLPRSDILTVDEIGRLVDIFSGVGVDRVRLTGGEPLMRAEVVEVVERMRRNPAIRDLSMTTNGLMLERYAGALAAAGLDRVTVSLDTLRSDRFRQLTRRDRLDDALSGIEAALTAGLTPVKVNTVVMKGLNDDELIDLLEYGRATGVRIRFIEYMDVGGATRWSMDRVVPRQTLLARIRDEFGDLETVPGRGSAPAERFRLPDGTEFGVIASTTAPFCGDCDRSRLTADGVWLRCLYAESGTDLRAPLRDGASDDELRRLVTAGWSARADRGAEERKNLNSQRGPLYQIEDLRADPHREMHTRGG